VRGAEVESWQLFILIVVATRLVFLEARRSRARVERTAIVFPVTTSYRFVGVAGTLLFTWMIVSGVAQGRWFALVVGILMLGLMMKAIPGPITVSPSGIAESRWLGLYRRQLPWDQIGAVLCDRRTGRMTALSKDAAKIIFTQVHVDPQRFREEISRYHDIEISSESASLNLT